ncbi:hypothetical protein PIIN_06308 [Serendipita indica DSM 11827]|uniref:Fe2OG dioxygenase domain-containing protein n=1 Tax=Serendipita indica (strain DSM 11827) TaxID=1109443 RepID=G4TM31_SERID|nr:hypothetical protein PIIN_06308 [Serendipita indica DSM 11827]
MDDGHDTEMLLAMLSSMMEGPVPSQEVLLQALVDADGDISVAAAALKVTQKKQASTSANKRKRGLEGWIVSKRKPAEAKIGSSTPSGSSLHTHKDMGVVPSDSEEDSGAAESVKFAKGEDGDAKPSKARQGPPVSLMSVLKQAPSSPTRPPKLVPRTLGTPALVAQHTPCTMHLSVLPPELACRLFYVMLREAHGWSRNKLVESPHKTSFYARNLEEDLEGNENMQEAAKYWYNGRPTAPPRPFLPEMEEACEIIEHIVNTEILKRELLYPLEWPTTPERPWRANVAAANCYTGSKETVGWHSDQLTYLGPCPTIASLSLGTTRKFSLREVVPEWEKGERNAQTFHVPVVHNSLLIMHASCQERFKHTIPPQQTIDAFKPPFPPPVSIDEDQMMPPTTSRINITFRFYRPDFAAKSIPRCQCDIPMILRPDMKGKQRDSSIVPPSNGKMEDRGLSTWEEMAQMRYFWMCYSGAQNEGKACNAFRVLDFTKEGRGLPELEEDALEGNTHISS